MPEKIIPAKLTLDSGGAEKSVKSFKAELKAANAELLTMSEKFGATSKEAAAAAKRVAGLKDAIGDAKNLSDAFNPDAKFRGFSNAISGVVGGFQGLTGAMALFGTQSEDVQKTLVKVQAAMALSQGINSVLEAKDSFIALASQIKNASVFQKIYAAGTALASTVTKAFGVSVNSTSIGFKALRAAIISTGIGALIVGVTALITAIIDWVSSTDDAKAAQDRLKGAIDSVNDSLKKQQADLRRASAEAVAKAKADGKSEEEIFKIQQDFAKKNKQAQGQALREKYDYVEQLRALRNSDEESEGKYQEALKDYQEGLQAFYDAESQIQVDQYNEQARLRERAEQDQQKSNEKAKAARDKAIDEQKKANEKQKELWREYNENLRKGREDEVKQIEDAGEALKAEDEANAKRLEDNIKNELEQRAKLAELNQINNPDDPQAKIDKIKADLNLELSALADNDIQRQILAQQAEDKILQIKRDASTAAVAIAKAEQEQKLLTIESTLGAISDLVGRDSVAGKVLAIGQATINTYLGATKALSQGGIFGPIAAAGVIAAGIANIKKIVSVQIPGKGGGGATPSVSNPSTAPLIPQVNSNTLLNQQAINDAGNAAKPVRAFITDGDARNNREINERLNRQARIG